MGEPQIRPGPMKYTGTVTNRDFLYFSGQAHHIEGLQMHIHSPLNFVVEMGGLEPPASTLRTWRSPD